MRLDRKEIFDAVPTLQEYAQDAVSFRPRWGSDALGRLLLNHTRAARNVVFEVEHLKENLRRNVVRVVARQHKRPTIKDLA